MSKTIKAASDVPQSLQSMGNPYALGTPTWLDQAQHQGVRLHISPPCLPLDLSARQPRCRSHCAEGKRHPIAPLLTLAGLMTWPSKAAVPIECSAPFSRITRQFRSVGPAGFQVVESLYQDGILSQPCLSGRIGICTMKGALTSHIHNVLHIKISLLRPSPPLLFSPFCATLHTEGH